MLVLLVLCAQLEELFVQAAQFVDGIAITAGEVMGDRQRVVLHEPSHARGAVAGMQGCCLVGEDGHDDTFGALVLGGGEHAGGQGAVGATQIGRSARDLLTHTAQVRVSTVNGGERCHEVEVGVRVGGGPGAVVALVFEPGRAFVVGG